MSDLDEFVQGLRDLADFYEAYPDLEIPRWTNLYTFYDTIEDAPGVAASMAPCDKNYTESFFQLSKKFGKHLTLLASWDRDVVCKKIQVGVKEIPEQIIPAHTEPVYEWDCGQKSVMRVRSGSDKDNQLTQGDSL
jgi:hypothetical protein